MSPRSPLQFRCPTRLERRIAFRYLRSRRASASRIPLIPALPVGGVAVRGHVHGVGLLAQPLGQHMSCRRFVFDQEDAHSKKLYARTEFIPGSCSAH